MEVVRSEHLAAAPTRVELLSAPDPDEEGRAIVRRLVADLESGVPLWRMAVGYGFAAALGIGLGLLMGRWRGVHEVFEPIIELARPHAPGGADPRGGAEPPAGPE